MWSETGSGRRSAPIDMLRGLAVLLVLVRHWPQSPGDAVVLRALAGIGWIGVDLFFVLSGYLISTLLYRELDRSGGLNIARFWLRRGLRIWPAYFAAFLGVIAVNAGLDLLKGRPWTPPTDQWPNLLLIQNYFPAEVRWPHTWSLAVEEHFYLSLPLLILLAGRKRLPILGVALCLLCLALRLVAAARGAGWADLYYPTHLRFDALTAGVLVGYACRYRPDLVEAALRFRLPFLAFFTSVVALAVANPLETSTFIGTFGFSLLAIAFSGVVMFAARGPMPRLEAWPARALAWVGGLSYTIYLAHGAMVDLPRYAALMRWAGELGGIAGQRAMFLLMSITGGLLLSWLVERPALALRRRLTERSTPEVGGSPFPAPFRRRG